MIGEPPPPALTPLLQLPIFPAKMLQNHPSPHILQSPARLGLPNPNSPSLSNPTTPKLPQPHPHQSPLPTTTLLSLLPPLSRAQTLLLHMASLANKLFQVSPNRSLWLSSFRGSLPSFIPTQSQALTITTPPLDSNPSSIKEIITLFTSLQTQLFESVAQLQEILDLQDAKKRISREIQAKDSVLLNFANKLKEAEHVLDVLVDDYSDYRSPKRARFEGNAETSVSSISGIGTTVKLSDILSYAHRISYTTFAPPEFGAGQAPLRGALPPAPQDEQMRASQLYNFADLDVGLPKEDRKDKNVDTLIEPVVPNASDVNPLGGMQGLLSPQITVPSGWQPGMPVELPTDLPLPPPGWKPGDPIPLPPMDALVPKKPEEVQPRPVAHMPPKAPEPIQVQFVQLDINPGQDEYSSDYSSDGSSEEDDED